MRLVRKYYRREKWMCLLGYVEEESNSQETEKIIVRHRYLLLILFSLL